MKIFTLVLFIQMATFAASFSLNSNLILRKSNQNALCNKMLRAPLKTTTSRSVRISPTSVKMGLFDIFSNEITVAKVQVAAYCPNRAPNSLLGTISRLADEADTDHIAELVGDVALALLRRESDWISGASELMKTTDEDKADDAFTQLSLKERAKVERETVNLIDNIDRSDSRGAEAKLEDLGKSTVAVVTFILALEGATLPQVKDIKTLREALTALGSIASTESLMAAEVMWTPEEPYDSLTPQEVNLEFPTLIPF